ncbi:putative ATP synthase F1, delta subunit [Anaerococcus lactolyticus ATCC 51172]|uniref:Putative ATP synthase F1, delta subunit n=1 Tax=Anaerococcus lactolyticus ATCC 51172 TaxID=525254 RepID=C2BFG8_9FIRM|nr:PTS sugar transporter subunit IIA [Anaerococcus lactolyticus]EEI86372.1 putative ATP synthase F1, delta subunit [Anaerococcus lactolyticus ATCC 51172]
MLGDREIEILDVLINAEDVKSNDLSTKFNVSNRTILRDLRKISNFLEKYGDKINSSKDGYKLISTDKNKLKSIIRIIKLKQYNDIYKQLFLFIVEHDNIKVSDLALKFYLSESSIKQKLNMLKKKIDKYNIKLLMVSGKIYIDGLEKDIRNYLVDNYMVVKNNILYHTLLELSGIPSIDIIKKLISKELIDRSITISDYDYSKLISLILVSYYRAEYSIYLSQSYINPIILDINKKLAIEHKIQLSKKDCAYITENSIFNKYMYDDLDYKINKIVDEALSKICKTSSNIYSFDDEFIKAINFHLKILIHRMELNDKIKNPLVNEIKRKFILEMNDAMIIKDMIYEHFNIQIDEDEVSYLAIYLMSSKISSKDKKNVIIICNFGIGVSQIVKMKIEQQYKNLNIIGVYPLSNLDLAISKNPDYIISTVNIDVDTKGIPVVDGTKVIYSNEPLVFAERSIKDILNKNLFFDIDVASKEEFFNVSQKLILKNNSEMTDKKLDVVENYDYSVSTDIGNLVAIPHAVLEGDFKSFVAIFRLKNQIIWNKENVKFVFLIVINKKEKFYIDELKYLYNYILDPSNLSFMINASNYDEFVERIL